MNPSNPSDPEDATLAEERAAWRQWQAASLGERDLEEVVQARREAGETEEQLARHRELFRPCEPHEHEAMVQSLAATLQSRKAERENDKSDDSSTPEHPEPSRSWWPVAAAVAMAACVLLWTLWPHPSLPEYSLEASGMLVPQRGTDAGEPEPSVLRYAADGKFIWKFMPQSAMDSAPGFRILRLAPEPLTTLDRPTSRISERTGVIELSGPVEALGLAPGRATIAIVIGTPDQLKNTEPDALLTGSNSSEFQRLTIELEIISPSRP